MIRVIKNVARWLEEQFTPAVPPPKAAPSAPPSDEIVALRTKQFMDATAALTSAFHQYATTTLYRYQGRNLLVTSSHAVMNDQLVSTGFDYKGQKLFPIVKGSHMALARLLAINPQGATCETDAHTRVNEPYRDIAVLDLLTPETSRKILKELSGENSRKHLAGVFGSYPDLPKPKNSRHITDDELFKLTDGFSLVAVPYSAGLREMDNIVAYSLGYHKNKPELVPLKINPVIRNSTLQSVEYQCDRPITKGHSGGPAFFISPGGTAPVHGIITSISVTEPTAYATNFDEVAAGFEAVLQERVLKNIRSLSNICSPPPGQSAWVSPDNLVPSAKFPRKTDIAAPTYAAGATVQPTKPCPTR